jgi:predicted NUDIX family NTP pyrophosphohydrolase
MPEPSLDHEGLLRNNIPGIVILNEGGKSRRGLVGRGVRDSYNVSGSLLEEIMPGERKRKQSAGTLLYRKGEAGLEVLLVHPSGHYNRRAPWSIPKGLVDGEEELEAAARRETLEETGVTAGSLTYLGPIDYLKSAKRIHCFAGPAPADSSPRCESWEVDQARFVDLPRARELLHPDQHPFLDRLTALISAAPDPSDAG